MDVIHFAEGSTKNSAMRQASGCLFHLVYEKERRMKFS